MKNYTSSVVELTRGNRSAFDKISELLRRNSLASVSVGITGQQIQHLVNEMDQTKTRWEEEHYPWELAVITVLLFATVGIIGFRLHRLARRLTAHESYELNDDDHPDLGDTETKEPKIQLKFLSFSRTTFCTIGK